MIRLSVLALLFSAALCAQVPTPTTNVQSDPGGSCPRNSSMQYNVRTGQYWGCEGNAALNWQNGIWTKIAPANVITTRTTDPTGAACDPKSIALRTPGGALFTCVSGVYAAAGGSLPVGSANKVVATPADGSSGASALRNLVAADFGSASTYNIAFGAFSLNSLTTGIANVGVGFQSLFGVITGSSNSALGNNTGISFAGSNGVLIGESAGYNNGSDSGGGTILIGAYTNYDSAGITGDNSICIGYGACDLMTGGTNTIIGAQAGVLLTAGTGNVFLGNAAGAAETGSNKLYIDNTNTATPLIGGDFMARTVALSGTVSIGTGAGAANTAVCWKAGGVLGWASNTMGVIGTTCN